MVYLQHMKHCAYSAAGIVTPEDLTKQTEGQVAAKVAH
jgi:hypothetical protein